MTLISRLQSSPSLFTPTATPHEASTTGDVVIATGRLPWALVGGDGGTDVRHCEDAVPASAVHLWRRHRSASRWVGWTGLADRPEHDVRTEMDERLRAAGVTALHLSRAEVMGFYHRFSNGVLRALLHETGTSGVQSSDWVTYRMVNARYAKAIAAELRVGDLVWIHDHHLMLVPRLLRSVCPWARISFFLHSPFPSVDTFARFPHALSLIAGLVGADAIELPTAECVWNFLAAVNATALYETRRNVVDDHGRRVCVFPSTTM